MLPHLLPHGSAALKVTSERRNSEKKEQLGADDPKVARAIFTLHETAAYLDVPKSTVQRWARLARGAAREASEQTSSR
jgi:hypothetical protein